MLEVVGLGSVVALVGLMCLLRCGAVCAGVFVPLEFGLRTTFVELSPARGGGVVYGHAKSVVVWGSAAWGRAMGA